MGRNEQFATGRRLSQQTNTHAHRLLWIVFEAVLPVRVLERDGKHSVTREGQSLSAGVHVDHAMPRRVAASDLGNHAWCHFVRVFERRCPPFDGRGDLRGRP